MLAEPLYESWDYLLRPSQCHNACGGGRWGDSQTVTGIGSCDGCGAGEKPRDHWICDGVTDWVHTCHDRSTLSAVESPRDLRPSEYCESDKPYIDLWDPPWRPGRIRCRDCDALVMRLQVSVVAQDVR